MMRINEEGLNIIKFFEQSNKVALKAYKCSAGKWTIGWGHTGPDVTEGLVITPEKADELLRKDLEFAEKYAFLYTKYPVNNNQFSAIVSLIYNIGPGGSKTKGRGYYWSSVRKKLNNGDVLGAADAFLNHVKVKNPKTGEYQILPGLVKRRMAEKELFLKNE